MIFFNEKRLHLVMAAVCISGFTCWTNSRPLMNLTEAKKEVVAYYEGGEYEHDLDAAFIPATRYFKTIPLPENAAAIFDVDATALDDYCDGKSVQFGFVPKLNHEWVLRAEAPAIDQTKAFYDLLVSRGVKIIFLTGRKHDEYAATLKNLKRVGYTTLEKLIVRDKNEKDLSAKEYKTKHRQELRKAGYKIMVTVGDQMSDLGADSGYEIRLPNYRYMID